MLISISIYIHFYKGETNLQVFLSAAPQDLQAASQWGLPLAHAAYRIGANSTLLRQNLLLQTQGGLLSVCDTDAPFIDDPDAVCAAVLRECRRRNYSGVLLDFEAPLRQDRLTFAKQLGAMLASGKKALYLPETYALAGAGLILINTAVSGGSFTQYLQESAHRYGSAARLALDIERLRMDFTLPAPSGQGKALSPAEFQGLMEREAPSVFFSPDLCARYFTYTQGKETHFVLFDDAETLQEKLRIGKQLGFSAAFFMWPEVSDLPFYTENRKNRQ